jgi:hypothetical protein
MIVTGGGALWAQGMGISGWSSPQSTATQGRIRSAADDFIRPDSYTSARVNDWFAMTSFASTSAVSLGYAKKLEKAYIGAYYGGTFWANLEKFDYAEVEKFPWPPNGDEKTTQIYTDLTIDPPTPNNRLALLIGIADMGFRLSFYSTHQSFSKKDIVSGDITDPTTLGLYTSYKTDYGVVAPQLAWSMTKNLLENGVKPYVTLDLNFQRDYLEYETAGSDAGALIGRSRNIVQPVFQAGLGGYTFYTKEAFRLSADFEYRLTANVYDNEYSYLDGGKYKTGKIKGLYTAGGAYTESSDVTHLIMPYLAAQWGDGPVALRGRLQLPVTYRITGKTEMDLNSDYKLIKDGTDESTTIFGFNPSIQLALQWRPITKLAINAGGLINLSTIGNVTTNSSSYTNDKEDEDSSYKTVAKTIPASVSNQLTLGVTFNPTEYLFFEAVCGGTNAQLTGNKINVFSTTGDGLFYFGSILVGLKF